MDCHKIISLILLLTLIVCVKTQENNFCNDRNTLKVARIVFGESRGEQFKGQVAVAWTILNRVQHEGYPNTLDGVADQKDTAGNFQYHTLSEPLHDRAWTAAQQMNTVEYDNALWSARIALCGPKTLDPTGCATDFCSTMTCPSSQSNQWWEVYKVITIGGHNFFCRRPYQAGQQPADNSQAKTGHGPQAQQEGLPSGLAQAQSAATNPQQQDPTAPQVQEEHWRQHMPQA